MRLKSPATYGACMIRRSQSFGSIAAAYERYRPGYPPALVDAVLSYAAPPVASALEMGAGTGKATRAFAERGVEVVATEPDAEMLAELRRHVPSNVRAEQATLEEVQGGATYDLVFAAAALHWTDAATRWARIADLLRPGGTFASFGGPVELTNPVLRQAVQDADRSTGVDHVTSPDGTPEDAAMQWPGTEMLQSDLFTDVVQSTIPRQITMSADDYIGHLGTISAYLVLPEEERLAVFDRVRGVLPAEVDVTSDLILHLARRHRAGHQ